jgi:hypothetical protein
MASTLFDVLKQRAVFDFEINFTSNANRELNLIAMAKPAEAKVKLEKCFEQTFWAEDEAELNSTSKSSSCRVPDFPFLRFRITRFERFVSFNLTKKFTSSPRFSVRKLLLLSLISLVCCQNPSPRHCRGELKALNGENKIEICNHSFNILDFLRAGRCLFSLASDRICFTLAHLPKVLNAKGAG